MSNPERPPGACASSPATSAADRTETGLVGGPRRRLVAWLERPHLRIFAPLAVRALGAVLLLCGVAYLGELERERSLYGPLRARFSAEQLERGTPPADPAPPERPPLLGAGSPPPAQPSVSNEGAQSVGPNTDGASSAQAGGVPCQAELPARRKAITEDGKVILNEANVEELTTLRGVGEKRAHDIVELRSRLGGFRKVSDLLRVRGIGWKSLQKLKDGVVLDRPEVPSDSAERQPSDPASVPSRGQVPGGNEPQGSDTVSPGGAAGRDGIRTVSQRIEPKAVGASRPQG